MSKGRPAVVLKRAEDWIERRRGGSYLVAGHGRHGCAVGHPNQVITLRSDISKDVRGVVGVFRNDRVSDVHRTGVIEHATTFPVSGDRAVGEREASDHIINTSPGLNTAEVARHSAIGKGCRSSHIRNPSTTVSS